MYIDTSKCEKDESDSHTSEYINGIEKIAEKVKIKEDHLQQSKLFAQLVSQDNK